MRRCGDGEGHRLIILDYAGTNLENNNKIHSTYRRPSLLGQVLNYLIIGVVD